MDAFSVIKYHSWASISCLMKFIQLWSFFNKQNIFQQDEMQAQSSLMPIILKKIGLLVNTSPPFSRFNRCRQQKSQKWRYHVNYKS